VSLEPTGPTLLPRHAQETIKDLRSTSLWEVPQRSAERHSRLLARWLLLDSEASSENAWAGGGDLPDATTGKKISSVLGNPVDKDYFISGPPRV